MPKKLGICVLVLLGVMALAVPQSASACERCVLVFVCSGGGADGCERTEICEPPPQNGISWANCDDSYGICNTYGEICRWA